MNRLLSWARPAALRFAILILLSAAALGASAADVLDWDARNGRVRADITGWNLEQLLEQVTAHTGWEIFLEPGTEHTVSTRFDDFTTGEALRSLLGPLNFAVVPQSEGPARLYVFQTSRSQATQRVEAPSPEEPLPQEAGIISNELVIAVKPGTNVEELARRLGAKITGRIDELGIYRLTFEDEASARSAMDALRDDPDVRSVEFNIVVPAPPAAQPAAFGAAPPLSLKPKVVGDSDRVIVGLVDTAVQSLGPPWDDFLLESLSVVEGDRTDPDRLLHGTSMFETILRSVEISSSGGESTPVRILSVNVFGDGGHSTTFDIARGIHMALEGGATLINLSLGASGGSSVLQTLIADSHAQGAMFFGAAGNTPGTTPTIPASFPEVIAVTAGDPQGNIRSYANSGDFVDVAAPDLAIVHLAGRSFYIRGTSVSTANVSGLAAALTASSGLPRAEIEAELRRLLQVKRPE